MSNESRPDDAKVEINNEDVHIGRQFCRRNRLGGRTQYRPQEDDPNRNDHALNDESRNSSFGPRVFGDSPKLQVPGIDQAPEYDRRPHRCKRERWTDAQGQTAGPENVTQNMGKDRLANRRAGMSPFAKGPSLSREDGIEHEKPCDHPNQVSGQPIDVERPPVIHGGIRKRRPIQIGQEISKERIMMMTNPASIVPHGCRRPLKGQPFQLIP